MKRASGIVMLLMGLSLISLLFISCSDKGLMSYYYPLGEKSEVLVYKYTNPINPEFSEYWKTTTDPLKRTILTESFTSSFRLYNSFEEKVNTEQAELLRYTDYDYSTKDVKEIEARIVDTQVFTSSKSEEYKYWVEYIDGSGRTSFMKTRRFRGYAKIEVAGKKYRTAVFTDNYFVEAHDAERKYEFSQTTYYAKSLGMIKYERVLPNGKLRILELEQLLSKEEFDKLLGSVGQ